MNFGQVLSKRTNKILKQSISKTGYYTIATKIGGRNGISKCFKVHRWIAEIFIPNDLNKPFINHVMRHIMYSSCAYIKYFGQLSFSHSAIVFTYE